MKMYFPLALLAILSSLHVVTPSENPSVLVTLESYEKCKEKTNIVFGDIKLDHGKNKKIYLTYNFSIANEMQAPIQMEANISAKDNKNDEYIHKFNPKKKDFCPSLEDENDLFTQIWHALGLKKIVCSIKAAKHKIENKEFILPKEAGDKLFPHNYWKIETKFLIEGNKDPEMCLILHLKAEKETSKKNNKEYKFKNDKKKKEEEKKEGKKEEEKSEGKKEEEKSETN